MTNKFDSSPASELEKAISAALEQKETPRIPVDFASRVAAQAAALPERRRAARPHYARQIALLLSAALVIALFLVAPHARPSFVSFAFDIELLVLTMLALLSYLLSFLPAKAI